MPDILTAHPIDEDAIPIFDTYAAAAASGRVSRIALGDHPCFATPTDVRIEPRYAFLIPRARVLYIDNLLLALTEDNRFLPGSFPHDWLYARYRVGDSFEFYVEGPAKKLPGDWASPFTHDFPHLYHALADNYSRLAWLKALGLKLPLLLPQGDGPDPGEKALAPTFLQDAEERRIGRGLYACDRLLVPPPGNRDNRYCPQVAMFLRDRLTLNFAPRNFHHKSRLFVSRADTPVRNVANEPELVQALRRRGFLPVCPGDYSPATQFEIFASAEIIMGVHGNGLTPILAARNCRLLIEIEAFGWPATPFSGLAGALGVSYRRVGATILPDENRGTFHWLAKVDCDEALAALDDND